MWAGAWVGVRWLTLGLEVLVGLRPFEAALSAVLSLTAQAGALGFASGISFSAIFGVINRRRSLLEVGGVSTTLAGGGVGAASALVVLLLLVGVGVPPAVFALNLGIGFGLGASVARGSLKLAQSEMLRSGELSDDRRLVGDRDADDA